MVVYLNWQRNIFSSTRMLRIKRSSLEYLTSERTRFLARACFCASIALPKDRHPSISEILHMFETNNSDVKRDLTCHTVPSWSAHRNVASITSVGKSIDWTLSA